MHFWNKKISLTTAICGLMAAGSQAVLIDFDSLVAGSNIHGVNLGGVTITAASGNVVVYAGSDAQPSPSAPHTILGANTAEALTFTFDGTVSFASLYGGDAGTDLDQWRFDAYDVGNNLLDTDTSIIWNGSPFEQLSVSATGIKYVVATWIGQAFPIAYDNLEFSPTAVPEPFTMALMGGAAVAGYRRMRRKKA